MSRWAWLDPEARAEVIGVLCAELRSARTMAGGLGIVEATGHRHSHGPSRWHRLRCEWLEAAIEQLDGEVPEDHTEAWKAGP